MNCLRPKITDIAGNPDYLTQKFYGANGKSLTEDMVCFQQAATSYLEYYKKNFMNMPWKSKQLVEDGDPQLVLYENRLHKYLNRMYDVVQQKQKKYQSMSEDAIYKELDKVIACQLNLEIPEDVFPEDEENETLPMNPLTGIPLVDIIVNIDYFTAHFEDRSKILRIVKELYNHCTTMKKLLLKNGKLILNILLLKYDQKCHLHSNKAAAKSEASAGPSYGQLSQAGRTMSNDANIQESREEFLAVIVGQLIRLYAKSKSMSQCFCNFEVLERIVALMQHEQYIIQSDAQKTFDTILKGPRLYENPERQDAFVKWIESSVETSERMNQMFKTMRNSSVYSFKRLSMKLQFEILGIGLKECTIYLTQQIKTNSYTTHEEYVAGIPDKAKGPYFYFASYFVDDKDNLKGLMKQLGEIADDEERIKEEMFMLLSYFILTFEYRLDRIKNIIARNISNFVTLIGEFRANMEDEDIGELLDALLGKLEDINGDSSSLLQN